MASGFGGRLGQQLLPDLLQKIASQRLTGVLRLSRNNINKAIAFDSGDPINALSSIPSEQLESRLIRDGHTTTGLVSNVKRMQKDPALLGAALVQKGLVSAAVMTRTAGDLATQIAMSVFDWTEGESSFQETVEPPCPRVLETRCVDMVIEGARQAACNIAFLDLACPANRTVTRAEMNGDHFAASAKLNSVESYILSLIQSPVSLEELAGLAGLPDEQVRPSVCALVSVGLLKLLEAPAKQQPAPAAEVESDPVLEAISRKVRVFESANYYEVLGVDKLALTSTINAAYRELETMFESYVAEYSDRIEIREKLDVLLKKIRAAHQTLSDPIRRRDYDRPPASSLSVGTPVIRADQPGNGNPMPTGDAVSRSRPQPQQSAPRKPVPIPVTIPTPAPRRPAPADVIERGQAYPSARPEPPVRKPIPIPEIQMPVAPKNPPAAPRNPNGAQIERGQWDGPRLAPPARKGQSGPLTRPPAVLSPEQVARLKDAPANPVEQAFHFFRQGRLRFDRREIEAAEHLFREAIRLDPTQAEYHFHLAVLLSIRAHARHEHMHHEGCHVTCKLGGSLVSNPKVRYEAEKHFLRAGEIDPSNPKIPLKLGQLYKQARLTKKAEHYLRLALMLDSQMHIAQHELDTLFQAEIEEETAEE